jgi:hypothetical protein
VAGAAGLAGEAVVAFLGMEGLGESHCSSAVGVVQCFEGSSSRCGVHGVVSAASCCFVSYMYAELCFCDKPLPE